MILLANILAGLSEVLGMVFWFLMVMVGIRVLISWVSPDPSNPIVRALNASTDPFLVPLRRFVPAVGGLDFSPILLFLLLAFLNHALVQSLADYAAQLRLHALQ